jgi:hypothetical protein
MINALTKVAAVYGLLNDSEQIRKHCLKLLSGLIIFSHFEKEFILFFYSLVLLLSRTNFQLPSLADIDLFHLLVSLCFTLPILFASKEISPSLTNVPTGNLNDLYLMRLIFMVHTIQILTSQGFLYDNNKDINQTKNTDNPEELETLKKLVDKIMKNQTYDLINYRKNLYRNCSFF